MSGSSCNISYSPDLAFEPERLLLRVRGILKNVSKLALNQEEKALWLKGCNAFCILPLNTISLAPALAGDNLVGGS